MIDFYYQVVLKSTKHKRLSFRLIFKTMILKLFAIRLWSFRQAIFSIALEQAVFRRLFAIYWWR